MSSPAGRFQPHHVAYAMVGTGLSFSLAANVTHGLVSNGGVGAVISGLVWPLSLLLAIEGAVRFPWPHGRAWMVLRVAMTTPVAATAAVVSYLHMSGLLGHWHEHWLTCLLGPVAVDGLTTLGAAALLVLDRAETLTESAQNRPPAAHEASRPATQPPPHDRPTEPTHAASPQVGDRKPVQAPVSQEAIDKVLAAIESGQPMGKAAIMAATGLSRATAGRALTHLVSVGRLGTIGRATRPDYVLAQSEAPAVAQ